MIHGNRQSELIMDVLSFWNDSVWSKVIAAAIVAVGTAIWGQVRFRWPGADVESFNRYETRAMLGSVSV